MAYDRNKIPVSERTVTHFLQDERVRVLLDGEWRNGTVLRVLSNSARELEVDVKVNGREITVRLRSEDIYHVDGNKEREP